MLHALLTNPIELSGSRQLSTQPKHEHLSNITPKPPLPWAAWTASARTQTCENTHRYSPLQLNTWQRPGSHAVHYTSPIQRGERPGTFACTSRHTLCVADVGLGLGLPCSVLCSWTVWCCACSKSSSTCAEGERTWHRLTSPTLRYGTPFI